MHRIHTESDLVKDIKTYMHAIWGGALLIMGVAVIFRIPHLMEKISNIEQYSSGQLFVKFCLYLMAVLLIGGGIKKIYAFIKQKPPNM